MFLDKASGSYYFFARPRAESPSIKDFMDDHAQSLHAKRRIQRGFSIHPDWAPALENIHFVLVNTTHAGNIGAVARVMKNMSIKNLTLVSCTDSAPSSDAFATASGAYDVVNNAKETARLEEALQKMVMAVGTSGRLGKKRITAHVPEAVIPEFMEKAQIGPVACVFGRESRGLTNEEMKLCTHHLIIPSDREFASLNVAHAAAIVGYEIFKMASRPVGYQVRTFQPASVNTREKMYEQMERVLTHAGFLDPSNPLRMMREIRRILNSATMDERDVTIVRGIFRKIGNLVRLNPPQATHRVNGEM